MATYVPSKMFRHLSNVSLQGLFEKFNINIDVDWENRKPYDVKGLCEQWKELQGQKSKNVSKLDELFQEISDLADGKCDPTRLMEEFAAKAEPVVELPEEFLSWFPQEQAAYIYLNERDVLWSPLIMTAFAEGKRESRHWADYKDLPKDEPDTAPGAIKRLENMLTDYFRKEKLCVSCKIDHYLRNDELFYFFATLQDSPKVLELHDDETQSFEPIHAVMPFRVFFAYNFAEGEFSLLANRGKKELDRLAAAILKELNGYDGGVVRLEKATYNLDGLHKRGFNFHTDPADGIRNVRVKSIAIAPVDAPQTEIVFKSKGVNGNVYDEIDKYIDRNNLPADNMEVQKVTISMLVNNPSLKFRTLSFELGLGTCNLKSQIESKRELGEKLIRSWRLKNV